MNIFTSITQEFTCITESQLTYNEKRYPALNKRRDLDTFNHLILSRRLKTDEKERPIIPNVLLKGLCMSREYQRDTTRLLEDYRDTIDHAFRYSGYSYSEGLARVITSPLPDNEDYLESAKDASPLRYARTRNKRTDRNHASNIRDLRRAAIAVPCRYEDQSIIAGYLNGLPTDIHADSIRNHLQAAWGIARLKDVGIVQRARDMAYEVYTPSRSNEGSYSPRLFGLSLSYLPKDLRRALLPEYIELDLQSCHISIIAAISGAKTPLLSELIRTDTDIWPILMQAMGIIEDTPNGDFKKIIKKSTYALVYGMKARNAYKTLVSGPFKKGEYWQVTGGLIPLVGKAKAAEMRDAYLSSPYIQELIRAVEKMKATIARTGEYLSAYGIMKRPEEATVESFLSTIVQSFEVSIIRSIFDVAISERDRGHPTFDVALYQFDGVSIKVNPDENREAVVSKLQKAVTRKANRQGIDTRLKTA